MVRDTDERECEYLYVRVGDVHVFYRIYLIMLFPCSV